MVEKFTELENNLKNNHDKFMKVLKQLRKGVISPENAISELAKLNEERSALDREIKAVLTQN